MFSRCTCTVYCIVNKCQHKGLRDHRTGVVAVPRPLLLLDRPPRTQSEEYFPPIVWKYSVDCQGNIPWIVREIFAIRISIAGLSVFSGMGERGGGGGVRLTCHPPTPPTCPLPPPPPSHTHLTQAC